MTPRERPRSPAGGLPLARRLAVGLGPGAGLGFGSDVSFGGRAVAVLRFPSELGVFADMGWWGRQTVSIADIAPAAGVGLSLATATAGVCLKVLCADATAGRLNVAPFGLANMQDASRWLWGGGVRLQLRRSLSSSWALGFDGDVTALLRPASVGYRAADGTTRELAHVSRVAATVLLSLSFVTAFGGR